MEKSTCTSNDPKLDVRSAACVVFHFSQNTLNVAGKGRQDMQSLLPMFAWTEHAPWGQATRAIMASQQATSKFKPLKCTFHFFHFGRKGGGSQEAPSEGPNRARPLETPCLGFCTLERTLTSRECLRRPGFHTWFTHVIDADAALAGDDSPG